MAEGRFPFSADDWKEQLQAEQRLAKMDLFEDLAALVEEEPCAALRQKLANRYRKLIGVSPEHRHDFRLRLERTVEGGGPSPDETATLIEA
jgi:hypothetical protein